MQRATCALLLVGLLFLPATAAAKPVSSSTFASSSVSSTVADINDWFQKTLGLDFYEVLTKVIGFMIFAVKLAINMLLEILPKIQDWISAYG
jgi:hypothetical protein